MKILLITTNYGGGAGIACRRQHQALLSNGFDSSLLVLNKVTDPLEKNVFSIEELLSAKKGKLFFKLLKQLNLIVNKIPVFFNKKVFINGPSSLFRIDQLELYKQADIVHLHWVPKIISWKHVFENKRKRIFWTLHDMNPFTGGNHYTCDYNYSKYEKLLQKNILKKIRYLKGCNLKIISPSVWLSNEAKKSSVFAPFEVVVIPNCLNTEIFRPKDKVAERNKLKLQTNKKMMLFVAENPNDYRKGMKVLLEALSELKHGEEVCLLVIGKKLEETGSSIEMHQLGSVNNEALLSSVYNAADFFVIPSLEDNLPNTIVESLACGTPVIGFNIGGLPDLIINNKTGLLAPGNDTYKLATCIDQFITMQNMETFSKQARELVEAKCTEKALLSELIGFYKKC